MASTSSNGSWDPCKVLKVNPWNPPNSTCVGQASSTGARCGWRFNTELLSATKTNNAMASLKFMSAMHPSKIDYSTLMVLAQNTLCYWHGSQADNICAEWEDAIEDYLRENSQSRAAVTPVKQEPYEARDAKQLRNGSAKVEATSEQEMTEMRHALGEVQAELEKSEARCSALLAKNSKLDRQQEEERASNARNIDLLRQNSRSIESVTQQLTNFQTWAKAQEEQKVEAAEQLKKRLAEKADEADKLRGQLAGRNANFEKNVAASSKEISRLEARVKELEALNRKYADDREEDARQIARLREQDRKVEVLTKQMDTMEKSRSQLAGRNAEFEKNISASSKETSRLEARVRELEALNRQYADGREEDATQISRLGEQDRKVEVLTKQMDAVSRELEEREDELSSLQPWNAKRGLFAVISWWPPRIVVRKMMMGKVMKRGSAASYVQSVV